MHRIRLSNVRSMKTFVIGTNSYIVHQKVYIELGFVSVTYIGTLMIPMPIPRGGGTLHWSTK